MARSGIDLTQKFVIETHFSSSSSYLVAEFCFFLHQLQFKYAIIYKVTHKFVSVYQHNFILPQNDVICLIHTVIMEKRHTEVFFWRSSVSQ